jgi:hypothetical protein
MQYFMVFSRHIAGGDLPYIPMALLDESTLVNARRAIALRSEPNKSGRRDTSEARR